MRLCDLAKTLNEIICLDPDWASADLCVCTLEDNDVNRPLLIEDGMIGLKNIVSGETMFIADILARPETIPTEAIAAADSGECSNNETDFSFNENNVPFPEADYLFDEGY